MEYLVIVCSNAPNQSFFCSKNHICTITKIFLINNCMFPNFNWNFRKSKSYFPNFNEVKILRYYQFQSQSCFRMKHLAFPTRTPQFPVTFYKHLLIHDFCLGCFFSSRMIREKSLCRVLNIHHYLCCFFI